MRAVVRWAAVAQALFVVFLWSVSKIIAKMGLADIPPYTLAALAQVVALAGLSIYAMWNRREHNFNLSGEDVYLAMLIGLVGYVGANLFVMIGLQYVTGATGGLIAATSSVFTVIISALVLKERPALLQYAGIAVIALGSYVFLTNQVITGSAIGVGLLLTAELAFAFSDSLVRMVNKKYDESVALPIALIANVVGVLVLVPLSIVADGIPKIVWHWQLVFWVVAIGLILGFGNLLWTGVLNRLRLIEAVVISNTMLIQVALFAVVFLGERLAPNNFTGGALVLVGAVITDGHLLLPSWFKMKGATE